ncbi:peptidoglycan recognition protein family protein [Lactobacillus jensenii]|uniref:peptidoglycan recognition protein family protein n=2 Tax=Lactobacillus jensenii TaxID=109790 RepID=UPI003EB6F3C3
MKRINKRLVSAMACASVLATVSAISEQVLITRPKQVKAASAINNYILNNKLQYGGLQVLPSTFTEDFPYRYGKPEGIVIHETATPGATAANEATYFRREWMNMDAYVHAFVDKTGVIQIHPTNRGVWGAGAVANQRFIQIELAEESNTSDFARSVNNDAIYVASLLKQYGLTPSLADGTGSGTIWSHNAVSQYLGGTNHTDPTGYFSKWGYSMSQFFDLVKYYYYGSAQATTTEKAGTTTDAGNAAIKVVYTSAIAEWKNPGSGVVGYLQKGTTQTVVGKIQVNGAWWYKLSSGNWVPGEYVYVTGASRIPTIDNNVVNQNTKVKIKYISGYSIAVWSNPAIGTTGQYLKDGTEVQTIGYTTANGKKWYKLANNTWIPAEYTEVVSSSTVVTNITNESNTVAINYPHYSIAVWSEPGRNSTGKYLSDGTKVQTVGYTTVNGKKWYKLADNTWIPAEYTKVVSSSTVVTNITNESNTVAINYPHYSIAVWGEPGKNSTGKYLSDGTKVQTVGYTTVNGKKWYKLADNTWIPAEYTKAVSSTDTTSGNNTVTVNYPGYSIVVWSEPGRNSTGKYISDGTSVKYYATANYNGQTWYKIGENQWVPGQYVKVNASNNSGSVTVKYISGYGIAIWLNPGRNSTGKYLENGTTVKYFETQNYNGQTWYKIGENQWVPAQYVSVN